MSLRWFCARTAPRREALAVFFVREKLGFRVENPTVLVVRSRRFQPWLRSAVRTPMFPSYLFVEFDPGDPAWRAIATQPGVTRLMGSGPEDPTPLPPGVVEEIVARPAEGLEALFGAASRPRPGAAVRVVSGPLEGREGVCCRSTEERVTVLLSLFGAPRPVAFTPDAVAAA